MLTWELSFTTDLVEALNLETISYFEQFDVFCHHNTQFCMTCLHGKTLGVLIIVSPAVLMWNHNKITLLLCCYESNHFSAHDYLRSEIFINTESNEGLIRHSNEHDLYLPYFESQCSQELIFLPGTNGMDQVALSCTLYQE